MRFWSPSSFAAIGFIDANRAVFDLGSVDAIGAATVLLVDRYRELLDGVDDGVAVLDGVLATYSLATGFPEVAVGSIAEVLGHQEPVIASLLPVVPVSPNPLTMLGGLAAASADAVLLGVGGDVFVKKRVVELRRPGRRGGFTAGVLPRRASPGRRLGGGLRAL